MEEKYINRYKSFCDSLGGLERARQRDPEDEFVLSGTVQKFNLTFDISWKVMKDILVKYHKIQDFATGSPRETLRTAYSVGLISDDGWIRMLSLRNNLAHDYNGKMAAEAFESILHDYLPLFVQLREKAGGYMEEMKMEN
ncbi:MAG: nucleotidyltransferase substrate binding protein [Lachnospiraceae bacterium]|nr:nucleotidyltransferase substrate binding protein [Lachnospiraceae bacterium]